MHVRRALLLFAIVLGLAAIATSLSRSPEESNERAEEPAVPSDTETVPEPSVSPGSATPVDGPGPAEIVFDASRDQVRRVDAGRSATVLVEVDEPGLAEIPDLGLSAHGDALTPARFEVRVSDAGRYELSFTPVEDDTAGPAGTLVVRAPDEQ